MRISSEIRGIWSCLTSIGETSKSRCDVIGKNSLWLRLLANQLVMVRTMSGGEPGAFEEIRYLFKSS